MLAPGSTLWLLRHELRVTWRGSEGKHRALLVAIAVVGALVLAGAVGLPLALALRETSVPLTPTTVFIADAALLFLASLSLSQTLAQAVQAFYVRGDLDLLLSSPLPARRVLAVRCLAMALSSIAFYLLLATPVLAVLAAFGHWRWLNLYPVMIALGLSSTAVGLMVAMGLFRVLGPRRTRTVSQVMAAFMGAGFFLAVQWQNLTGEDDDGRLMRQAREWIDSGAFDPGSFAAWPARAAMGETLPALAILALSSLVFAALVNVLGRRFADDAAAAAGREGGRRKVRDGSRVAGFASGVFAATVRKELRLLGRDPALISQVLLRVLYLAPLAFILWRQAPEGDLVVAGLASAVAVVTSQLAASLTWVTVATEDAPDLLAASPAPSKLIVRGKIAAALAPVAALLALPLVGLTVVSPWAGVATVLACAGAALSGAMVMLWYGKPGKRTDLNRGKAEGGWIAGFAVLATGAAWAGTAFVAVIAAPWALAPLAAALILTAVLRRSTPGYARLAT